MKLPQADHRRYPVSELHNKEPWSVGNAHLTIFQHKPTGAWLGVMKKGSVTSQFVAEDKDQLIAEMEAETSPPPPPIKGYKGAIARFLYIYPSGFENPAFVAGERGGKVEAGRVLKPLLDPDTTDEDAVALLRSARTVLNRGRQSPLHMTESSDLDEAWRGPGAGFHLRALRAFAAGDRDEGFRLTTRALEGRRCSWPMVTLFPALLLPDREAVLRPEAVNTYARSVRSSFAQIYEFETNVAVYEAFLEMLDQTEREIASLKPRDYIDLVSFVWVATSYSTNEKPR